MISVSNFARPNGSVATLMPIEARIEPAGLGQQTHVIDRLAHLPVRQFERGEHGAAHHLKAGEDEETDALHGASPQDVLKRPYI